MLEKRKILFIAKNIPIPGDMRGNEIIYTIASKLNVRFAVTFFFPKSRVFWGIHFFNKYKTLYKLGDWQRNGLAVHVVPFIQLPGLFFTYWLFCLLPQRAKRLFKENRYDLIHAHYGMPDGYLAYLLSRRFDVPYVLTLRNHDVLHMRRLKSFNLDYHKYIKVLRGASKIFVTNANLVQFFNHYGIDATIMPHGIDAEELLVGDKQKVDDRVHIACVSNYISSKNIEWVIDAVLHYEGDKEVELSIIGDMNGLEPKYANCDNRRIRILGKQAHAKVMASLESSDIFALPSTFETFGLVYLEAAAKQNAIIGFKGQGVWGVFDDKIEMLFADSYEDFKHKLHCLIDDDKLRHSFQENAYKKAQEMTWNLIVERYEEVYNTVGSTQKA